jgi:predicted SprT family Zn-dependent metalloprotease
MNPSASEFNTVSTIDNDDNDSKTNTYFCNYCNTKLNYQTTDETTGKQYWCTKCGISFIPANQLVKRSSKFETPQGPDR